MEDTTNWRQDTSYRFGFNGYENLSSVAGEGSVVDFGARIYNSHIGKFLSTDPYMHSLSHLGPYNFADNQPIWAIDKLGTIKVIIHYIDRDINGTVREWELVVYDKKTLEELNGADYSDVHITVVRKLKEYHPYPNSSYTYTDYLYESSTTNGGLNREEQAFNEGETFLEGLACGIAFRYMTGKFGGYFTSALLGKDLKTGENLNGFETASMVFNGVIDILSMGSAKTELRSELENLITSSDGGVSSQMEEAIYEKSLELMGLEENEYTKLVYGLYKLGKDKVLNPEDITNLKQLVVDVANGAKTLSDFYGEVWDRYGVNVDVDYATVEEATEAIIEQVQEENYSEDDFETDENGESTIIYSE